jgi:sec-independent protein translocase protein TatC
MAFGLAFQLPVVISLLARAGVVNVVQLRKWRKFAFLIILVIAAAVTPPDPFSQFIFGLPLYLLYESGIITAAVIARGKRKREEAEAKEAAREAAAETSGAKPA